MAQDPGAPLSRLPAIVLQVDRNLRLALPLSARAVELGGGPAQFEFEAVFPGLAGQLAHSPGATIYQHPDQQHAWCFAVTHEADYSLLVGVEATPLAQERQLQQDLNRAVLAIAAERGDEARLLQRIIDTARELSGARYGALGVFGVDRRLRRFIVSGITAEEQDLIGPLPVGLGILGVLRFSDRPIRISDLEHDPMAHGFPPNHPAMHSFLGVPMLIRGENVGNIYLTEKAGGGDFSDEDEEIIQALAAHAALAVENLRLLGRLQEFAVSEERERIRRDLHDGVIQSIYGLGLGLELLEADLEGDQREAVGRAVDGVNQIITDLRAFISGLHPVLLSSESFEAGLSSVISEASQRGLIIQSNVQARAIELLAPEAQAHVLQFVREGLANVRRHAQATTASVAVALEGREIVAKVVDDGRGFDPVAARSLGSQGLVNMASRADALEGSLRVRSTPGAGSTVELRFPAVNESPTEPAEV